MKIAEVMADAFEDAWDVTKNRPINPNQPNFQVMEGRMGVPEEEPMVETNLEPQGTMGSCCESFIQQVKTITHGTPYDMDHWNEYYDYNQPFLDKYGGSPDKHHYMTDWLEQDCDEVMNHINVHILDDLNQIMRDPGFEMLHDVAENIHSQLTEAIENFQACERGEFVPEAGDLPFGMGGGAADDIMIASNDSFNSAWDIAKEFDRTSGRHCPYEPHPCDFHAVNPDSHEKCKVWAGDGYVDLEDEIGRENTRQHYLVRPIKNSDDGKSFLYQLHMDKAREGDAEGRYMFHFDDPVMDVFRDEPKFIRGMLAQRQKELWNLKEGPWGLLEEMGYKFPSDYSSGDYSFPLYKPEWGEYSFQYDRGES